MNQKKKHKLQRETTVKAQTDKTTDSCNQISLKTKTNRILRCKQKLIQKQFTVHWQQKSLLESDGDNLKLYNS